jgi:hypothetical protein
MLYLILGCVLLQGASTQGPYANCAVLGGHRVEWSTDATNLQMRIAYTTGASGWVGVGFNSAGLQMPGASIVMGYGTNVNEYSASAFAQPSLVTPKITNTGTFASGSGQTLQFTRPLTAPGYFGITNTPISLLLAYNDVSMPTGPNSWNQHVATSTNTINLFTPSSCPFNCFNIPSSDPTVCSGHGSCLQPDNCTCASGWRGPQCNTAQFSCFNLTTSAPTVCNGHGTCQGQDSCACNAGWGGGNCSLALDFACATLGGHDLTWNILPSKELQMTISFSTGGTKGWVAVGFNSPGQTMVGASIIMAYGNNVNEYHAISQSQPDLVAKRITKASAKAVGDRLIVSFVRPLSDSSDPSYFAIPSDQLSLMLVYNDANTPTSATSFSQHTQTYYTSINLHQSTCVPSGPPVLGSVFPFHYLVLAVLFLLSIAASIPIVYFLNTIPGFDVFLHWKLLPFIRIPYVSTYLNDFNLSLGEIFVVFLYVCTHESCMDFCASLEYDFVGIPPSRGYWACIWATEPSQLFIFPTSSNTIFSMGFDIWDSL